MDLELETETTERDAAMLQQSREFAQQYGIFDGCPMVKALDVIRRKWAIQILMTLYNSDTPMRFNQLERELAPITQKELTKRLRELEQTGIVSRTIYPEVPPHVEYQLTEAGRDFKVALCFVGDWSRKYYGVSSIS